MANMSRYKSLIFSSVHPFAHRDVIAANVLTFGRANTLRFNDVLISRRTKYGWSKSSYTTGWLVNPNRNPNPSSVEVCLGGLDLGEWNSANKVFKLKWLLSRSGDPPPYPPPPAAALGEQVKGEEREIVPEQELFHRPRSVKWLDRGHSSVCAELFGEYRTLLWNVCGQALWQHFQFPTGGAIASVNLCSDHQKFLLLHTWRHISTTGILTQKMSIHGEHEYLDLQSFFLICECFGKIF